MKSRLDVLQRISSVAGVVVCVVELVLLAAFIQGIVSFVLDLVRSFSFSVHALPESIPAAAGKEVISVRYVTFNYYLLVMVVLAIVVFCVALAFEHGTLLQKESDETL